MVENTSKQKENPIFLLTTTPQEKLMHSQHFLAAAEHVYFRKTPEFVVFRFGLSQGLRQRRQPRSPGSEDAFEQ
jgi:hypothetical protein